MFRLRGLAPGSQVPVLATADGVIQDSAAILDWAGLAGGDAEIETRVATRLAVLGRRLVYAGLLNEAPAHTATLLFDPVRGADRALGRAAWPLTRRLMIRGMKTRLTDIPDLERAIAVELEWLEQRLGGRGYFVGDTFTRTDLTVASLAAVLVHPPGCAIYASVQIPPSLQPLFERWREHPIFDYVRRMYARHRGPQYASSKPA